MYYAALKQNDVTKVGEFDSINKLRCYVIEKGYVIVDLEDDDDYSAKVFTVTGNYDDFSLDLIESLEADDSDAVKLYALLAVNFSSDLDKLTEFNIHNGTIYDYANELVATKLKLDIDDSFIHLYVNVERYARDLELNEHLTEFRFKGKYYTHIPC